MQYCVARCTMRQLGMSLSEGDIHAMMRSVGVGPHGKISYPGISHFCSSTSNKVCIHINVE